MQGFDDPTNPIYVVIKNTGALADGGLDGQWPIPAGPQTVAYPYGLLTTVEGTRYLIPWGNIAYCSQLQPS